MFLRQGIRCLSVLNFALGTVLIAVEISVCLFRSAEVDVNDQGTMHEEIIALAAGIFTVLTGALILYMNEKPPRELTASRLYYIGSCVLAFISFALLIATLILFYTLRETEEKPLDGPLETLQMLVNTAIVFTFILLFTMAILYILFVCSCARAIMCHDPEQDRRRHAARIQKYRDYMGGGETIGTTDMSLGGSTTVGNSLELPTAADVGPCILLSPLANPGPLVATRKYLGRELGPSFSCSIETR